MRVFSLSIICLLSCVVVTMAQERDEAVTGTITPIRGSLYRAEHAGHTTVFLIGSDGIVLGDPLDLPGARWLRHELEMRHPGLPVRHVLHTSHHPDRAEGGAVFDRAERIAHDAFNRELSHSYRVRAGYGGVRPAPQTYRSRRTIRLDAAEVQLVHAPTPAVRELTLLYFPEERVVFAAHHPPVAPAPATFAPNTPQAVLGWLRTVTSLEVDLLLSGDGRVYSRDELTTSMTELDALVRAARGGVQSGHSVAQIHEALTTSDRAAGEPLLSHVVEAVEATRLLAVDVQGAALLSPINRHDSFCALWTTCTSSGGSSPAGMAAVYLTVSRFAAGAEVRMMPQFTGEARSEIPPVRTFHTLAARRDTVLSLLARYEVRRRARSSIGVTGGVALAHTDVAWRSGMGFAAPPDEFQYSTITGRSLSAGLTGGADINARLSHRLSLVAPIRFTFMPEAQGLFEGSTAWIGNVDFHAGVGLRVSVLQRAR